MKTVLKLGLLLTIICASALKSQAQSGPYRYYPLTPCRVVDTRKPNGTNGGPAFIGFTERDFQIRGGGNPVCGVPSTAKAVSLNITVVNATLASFITVWPSGITRPVVSTINFDQTIVSLANGAIVPLSANTQDLAVYNDSGSVNVIIDVTGYFQ